MGAGALNNSDRLNCMNAIWEVEFSKRLVVSKPGVNRAYSTLIESHNLVTSVIEKLENQVGKR
jgi:hypothetical protein